MQCGTVAGSREFIPISFGSFLSLSEPIISKWRREIKLEREKLKRDCKKKETRERERETR